jgi:hypothetical protein
MLHFEVEAVVESSGLWWPGEIPTRTFDRGARQGDEQGNLADWG